MLLIYYYKYNGRSKARDCGISLLQLLVVAIHFSCCFCKICNFTYSTDASVTLKRVSMWPRARNHQECVALPQCFGSYLAQLSCFNFLTQRRAECHCRTASLEHAKCLNQQSGTEERVRNDFWLICHRQSIWISRSVVVGGLSKIRSKICI